MDSFSSNGCVFGIVIFVATIIHSRVITHLIITRVGPCKLKQKFAVTVSEFQIFRVPKTYNYSIHGKIDIATDVEDGWNMTVAVDKCLDIRNSETCDLFESFDLITFGCMNDLGSVTKSFFENTQPRLTCPIRAGAYSIARFPYPTVDYFRAPKTTKASAFFGYSVSVRASGGGVTLACARAEFRLVYARRHDWGVAQPAWPGADAPKPPDDAAVVDLSFGDDPLD